MREKLPKFALYLLYTQAGAVLERDRTVTFARTSKRVELSSVKVWWGLDITALGQYLAKGGFSFLTFLPE